MRLVSLVLILKYAGSMVYKDTELDGTKKWLILYEEKIPSKLACVQKALYFKAEGIYDEGKCQVIKEEGGGKNELISTSKYFQKMVGNVDKLVLEWRQKIIIDSKIKLTKDKTVTKIPALDSEYKISFQVILNSYDGIDNQYPPDVLQIIGLLTLPYNMLKFFLNTDKTFGASYKMNEKTEEFASTTPIPLHQWYVVTVQQKKISSSGYELQTWFNGQLVHTMELTSAPSWQSNLNIYASNPWNIAADGFVSNIIIYEKVHK